MNEFFFIAGVFSAILALHIRPDKYNMKPSEAHQQLIDFWNNTMPFNQLLGLRLTHFDAAYTKIQFDWQDTLIGNPIHKILHGGVTASALDLAGSTVAAANIIKHLDDMTPQTIATSLNKLSTIDLRTDFLRPGRGKHFVVTARVIRSGSKVAVTRMEMHNDKNEHIAFGTGTYMVG